MHHVMEGCTWLSKGVGEHGLLVGSQLSGVLGALHTGCGAPGGVEAVAVPRDIYQSGRRRLLSDLAGLCRQHVQVHLQLIFCQWLQGPPPEGTLVFLKRGLDEKGDIGSNKDVALTGLPPP